MQKKLYRQIEELLGRIDDEAGDEEMLTSILRQLVESEDATDLGIESGRLYRQRSRDYLLIESFGEFGDAIAGKTVDKGYRIVRDVEQHKRWLISPESPGFDPELEAQFSDLNNAAILVGRNPAYILSLSISREGTTDDLLLLLETIRATIGLKLRQNVLESQMRQARSIQLSLLPRRMRRLKGFDLAALTVPADEVGGDVYDVQRVEKNVLSLMVADASGHGLPAALQARDVVTGLRMGQDKDEKITALVQRLNRVINRSGLTTRFVSLFFAELEATGSMTYVNCGHCPPLLFTEADKVYSLRTSGPVLGPLPEAKFHRHFLNLRPGEMLVLFSDGVTERTVPEDDQVGDDEVEEIQEFGTGHLIEVCRKHRGATANTVATAILEAVRKFGGGEPFADDVTVMIVRRLPADEFEPEEGLGLISCGDEPSDPDSRR